MIHLVSQSLSLTFMADLGDRLVEICVCDLNVLIRNWGFVFVDLSWVGLNLCLWFCIQFLWIYVCDLIFGIGSHARKLVAVWWCVGFWLWISWAVRQGVWSKMVEEFGEGGLLLGLEEGHLGLLTWCHLCMSHVGVMWLSFPSNIRTDLTLGYKI